MHFNNDPDFGETDTFIYDFSGSGHYGTAVGAIFSPDGRFGGVYSFDGIDDVIELPDDTYALPGKSGVTLAAWVKPEAGQTDTLGLVIFLDRGNGTATRIMLGVNSDRTVSVGGRAATETFQTLTTTDVLPLGEWSHIVGVIDLATNSIQIYINGAESANQTMAFAQTTFANTVAINSGIGTMVGQAYAYRGMIDEAALFDRSFTAGEVSSLYNSTQLTGWDVFFSVADIPEGSYTWNCVAHDIDDNENSGDSDWTFTIPITAIEVCDNSLDDDGDALIDCADEDCEGFVIDTTICGEGVCASTGELICSGGGEADTCQSGLPTEDPETTCDDGLDNDCDGLTDGLDSENCPQDYPVISNPVPEDNATNIPLTLAELQFTLVDPEGDPMDYTVTTSPDIGGGSGTGVTDGTYTVPVSGLAAGTTYNWTVSATDGVYETNKTFSFTTPLPLTVTLNAPPDGTPLVTTDVVFECSVTDDTGIKDVSLYTDISGTFELTETLVPPYEYSYDPSMQIWMHFNKDSDYGETDTFIYDFSGSGHNGSAGGALFSPDGRFGGAYSFDGVDDFIGLPDGTYDLPGKSGATLAAWVKPEAGQTTADGEIIYIDRGIDFPDNTTRLLMAVRNDQTIKVQGRSSTEGLQATITTDTIPLGEWSHIVGVMDLATNSIQIYINGELSISQTKAFSQTTFANTVAINPGLGNVPNSSTLYYNYRGMIDEAALFDRSFTAEEVQDLYNGTRTVVNASFNVADIPEGSYTWNCVAHDIDDNEDRGDSDWSFTITTGCTVDGDCGICEKCEGGACILQTALEDVKDECDDLACTTGFCDGAGACGFEPPTTE